MNRRCMLIGYREQTRNVKLFVLFQQPRVNHVEQNDVIIACIKWPHESNHKRTVNKKNERIYVLQSWNWYTDHDLAYPDSVAHHSPSGLHLVGDWPRIHLQLNKITNVMIGIALWLHLLPSVPAIYRMISKLWSRPYEKKTQIHGNKSWQSFIHWSSTILCFASTPIWLSKCKLAKFLERIPGKWSYTLIHR